MLEIKNLHVSVGGKEILKGLNLSIRAGEVRKCHDSCAAFFVMLLGSTSH